ncbi:MAG: alpha/beta hydrolase [Thiotrichales bacterium]|nr:MAG: alpha/beta hydrolase [Thiotrichales bacterium]
MSNESYPIVSEELPVKAGPAKPNKAPAVPVVLRLMRAAFSVGGVVFPRLAGRLAYRLWLTPTRFRTPVSEQAVLTSAVVDQLELDGMRIATYAWGQSGPAVLLVHGWSGRGTQLGAFVEPLINAGYRVISFDAPAHGNSSGRQTSLYQIADVVVALNQRLGPFESVITHSFGGPCLAAAMQQGVHPAAVVSLSPPASVAVLVHRFAETLAIPARAEQDFVRRFKQAFGDDILEVASMQNNVRNLAVPALVIHDEDDKDVPWQEGRAVAQAWNGARFIRTSKLGHRRILRDPATIEASVEFIRSNQSKADI